MLARVREAGHAVVAVYVPPDKGRPDPLAAEADALGIPLRRHARFRRKGEALGELVAEYRAFGAELNLMPFTTVILPPEIVEAPPLGSLCFHPSLLPRHRGMAAIEWTIKEGDPIAGGSIYHLADRMDAGAIAAQDWVFVKKGETARELWERALAPLGLRLLGEVIDYGKVNGALPAKPQDEQFATKAPNLSPGKH